MSESGPDPRVVRAAFLEIVDNQLKMGDPPETRATLERLIASGSSRREARRLIACVVATEFYEIIKEKREFDSKQFVERLNRLPEMPWDEE